MTNRQNHPERTDTPSYEATGKDEGLIEERLIDDRNDSPSDVTAAAREEFEKDTREGERRSDEVERTFDVEDPSHAVGSIKKRTKDTP